MSKQKFPVYQISDLYNEKPILQSLDEKTNQISHVLNLQTSFYLSENIQVENINDFKCNYCKGFYFPVNQNTEQNSPTKNKNTTQSNNGRISKAKSVKNQHKQNQFICGLCGSINQTKNRSINNIFPQLRPLNEFSQTAHHNDIYNNENSAFYSKFQSDKFQSVILSSITRSDSIKNDLNNKSKSIISSKKITQDQLHSVYFIFYIDQISLQAGNIYSNVLNYLKCVIKDIFQKQIEKRYTYIQQNNQSNLNNNETHNQNLKHQRKQNYYITFAINHNEKLCLCDFKNQSTVCIDGIVKQKFVPISQAEFQNIQLIKQKELQRNKHFLYLLHQASLLITSVKDVNKFQSYFDLLIQQAVENEQNGKRNKKFVSTTNYFNDIMESISRDSNSLNSYVPIWLFNSPLINYQSHKIKRSSTHSIIFNFYTERNFYQTTQTPIKSKKQRQQKQKAIQLQKKNMQIKNQISLIKDNNEVHFIDSTHNIQQFYYKLYEVFNILQYTKIFKPKFYFKTDNKYAPLVNNQLPTFFIKPTSIIMFITSNLTIPAPHNKFQFSIRYEDYKQQQKIWIINWTRNQPNNGSSKIRNNFSQQSRPQQRKTHHKQIQLCSNNTLEGSHQLRILQNQATLCNYFYLLLSFIQTSCLIKKSSPNQIATSVNTHFITVVLQTLINKGIYKHQNNIQINSVQYFQALYDYCFTFQKISPYQILKLFSSSKYNIKQTVMMIYPLVIIPQQNYLRNISNEEEYQTQLNQGKQSSLIFYWIQEYIKFTFNSDTFINFQQNKKTPNNKQYLNETQHQQQQQQEYQKSIIDYLNEQIYLNAYSLKRASVNLDRIDNQMQENININYFYVQKIKSIFQFIRGKEVCKNNNFILLQWPQQ